MDSTSKNLTGRSLWLQVCSRRISRTFLTTLMMFVVFMLLAIPAWAEEFAGGSGTSEDPYLVATAGHLDNVRHHEDAHFLQPRTLTWELLPGMKTRAGNPSTIFQEFTMAAGIS